MKNISEMTVNELLELLFEYGVKMGVCNDVDKEIEIADRAEMIQEELLKRYENK